MKIAILADLPLKQGTGGNPVPHGTHATWLYPLAQAFSSKLVGLDVHWISVCDRINSRQQLKAWNQSFVSLPTSKRQRSSTLFRKDRSLIFAELDRIRPDLVHAWGSEDVYALAAATSGYPFVVSMQGIMIHYVLHSWLGLRSCWQALIELFVLRRGRHFVCESPWAAATLRKWAPRAYVERIEYGVNPDFYQSTWSPDPNHPIALFAGTPDARKGIHDALAAFRSPELKGFELWIAGNASVKLKTANQESNIKWLGSLSRVEMLQVMAKAWCLVLPTRADTGPMIIKEARVVGMPVVTTRCGGQSTYIKDGCNGFFVSPGDVRTLVHHLHALLSNHQFCVDRGQDGWEADRQQFHVEDTAERMLNLYRQLGLTSCFPS